MKSAILIYGVVAICTLAALFLMLVGLITLVFGGGGA
jgi:hypothetical protein